MTNESRGRFRGWLGGERSGVHLALLTVQLGYGGYYVLTKAAMSSGVNAFVFAVYRDCIGLSLLAPTAFFYERSQRVPLTWPTALLILGLGLTGVFLQQALFLAGLSLTTTAFAAAMQNSIPVFTFIIAVLCRVEIIRFNKIDGIAKMFGIVFCVAGATTMSLYKGPVLLGNASRQRDVILMPQWHEYWTSNVTGFIDEWKLGSLFLVANCFCMGVYTNLQVPALKRFPTPFSLTALSISVGSVPLIITGLLTVSEKSDWLLTKPGNIVSAVYAGAIASGLNFTLQTWSNQRGGPVLLAAYVPLQAIFSAALGLIVLSDPINLGTVIGGVLILTGLYLVIWGQRTHKQAQNLQVALPYSAVIAEENTPLLPAYPREQ